MPRRVQHGGQCDEAALGIVAGLEGGIGKNVFDLGEELGAQAGPVGPEALEVFGGVADEQQRVVHPESVELVVGGLPEALDSRVDDVGDLLEFERVLLELRQGHFSFDIDRGFAVVAGRDLRRCHLAVDSDLEMDVGVLRFLGEQGRRRTHLLGLQLFESAVVQVALEVGVGGVIRRRAPPLGREDRVEFAVHDAQRALDLVFVLRVDRLPAEPRDGGEHKQRARDEQGADHVSM